MAETSNAMPPRQPTAADVELLAFATGIELAMVDLYRRAASANQGDMKTVAELFTANHRAAAQALSGLIGRQAPRTRNEKFFAEHSGFGDASGAKETAAYLAGLENALVATHLGVLGTLRGIDGANLVASILPVEARQATVLVGMSGVSDLDAIMALDSEAAIDPTEYSA